MKRGPKKGTQLPAVVYVKIEDDEEPYPVADFVPDSLVGETGERILVGVYELRRTLVVTHPVIVAEYKRPVKAGKVR